MIKRLSFFVSGNPQWEDFADTAISIGNELYLKGYAQNLMDGRIYIVAEGEENTLWLFENRLELQNRYRFTEPTYQFDHFGKLMGEADEKMEEIKSLLKDVIVNMNRGFDKLNNSMETGFNKVNTTLDIGFNHLTNGQDRMLKKQDETLKTLNNINNDTSEIKSTMKTMEMDIRDARFSLSHLIETKLKKHE